jgi:hypothetical protein
MDQDAHTYSLSIVLFIMPPTGVLFIHVLAGLMIIIGLALGWLWGVITMKAALAARPQADLENQYGLMQQSLPQNTTNVVQASGQSQYTQIAIYDGYMLDVRVSVVYYCMIGLFVYFVVSTRQENDNLPRPSKWTNRIPDSAQNDIT